MDEVPTAWNARQGEHNRLPHLFSSHVTGSVDTFPVYVSRPKNAWWQKKLYNGKYGANVNTHDLRILTFRECAHYAHLGGHVAKFQIACDHRGTPIYWSGPHLGTMHDIKIWKQNSAKLGPRERWLADKAYCSKGTQFAYTFL